MVHTCLFPLRSDVDQVRLGISTMDDGNQSVDSMLQLRKVFDPKRARDVI